MFSASSNSLPKTAMTIRDYWDYALPAQTVRKPSVPQIPIAKNPESSKNSFASTLSKDPTPKSFKEEIQEAIEKAAKEFQIPSKVLNALVHTESNYNPNAVSSAGAKGLTQLMPGTAREMGVKNIFDIQENVHGGARYLRKMLDSFDQDLKLALAAYNAGPGSVKKYEGIPPYSETKKYVSKIMNRISTEI